jgi:hypothetical protein
MHCALRRGQWFLAAALMATGMATGTAAAQDTPPSKHDAGVLDAALKRLINVGADLFNESGDHAGCYRVYQGGLLSIQPVLPGELQTRIDAAFRAAEQASRYSDKAFELRKALDDVRAWAKKQAPPAVPSVAPAPGVAKKETPPAKKVEVKVDPNLGQVAGKVTYNGQPAPPGFVTLVGDGRRFSTSILADGTFRFRTGLTPGAYRVAIERTPGAVIPKNLDVPERYRSENTSGITIQIERGQQIIDFDLVR